ncbi:MAG: alkaline phosphatase family protein, partial [Spirochaetota bacterium]
MLKAVQVGIDGLNPGLVDLWIDHLPNFKKMHRQGIWGELDSTIPPSNIVAWTATQSGRNPGAFGFWDSFYQEKVPGKKNAVSSEVIDQRVDCLYRILPRIGKKVALVNVPGTRPPPGIPGGYCVSGPGGNGADQRYVWPQGLEKEVQGLVGNYIHHLPEASQQMDKIDRDKVLEKIYTMDQQRFQLASYFINQKKCDYVLVVANGMQFVGDIFMRSFDHRHRFYKNDPEHQNTILDYYRWVDDRIGELCDMLDQDTVLLVHSVYASQSLMGAVNLNEWLIQNGYLKLFSYPSVPSAFSELSVDWKNTVCWSAGSWGQIYVNLKGRQPLGIVGPDRYQVLVEEIISGVEEITDENGTKLNTRIYTGDENFSGDWKDYGPDIIVNFDSWRWKTSDSVDYGQGNLHSFGSLKKYGGEGHGQKGYFCIYGPDVPENGKLEGTSVMHLAPTIMNMVRLEPPHYMEKSSIFQVLHTPGME